MKKLQNVSPSYLKYEGMTPFLICCELLTLKRITTFEADKIHGNVSLFKNLTYALLAARE